MLEAWVSILHEAETFPAGFSRGSGIEVFNTYLQCNLFAPDGFKGKGGESGNDSDDEEEIGDTEESDRVKYKETLATVGALGRLAPGHSLPILTELMEKRISRLHGQIHRLVSHGDKGMDKVLSSLYDDLYWILLIAGKFFHVISGLGKNNL